jgi:predicted outer membrane repeat protein
MLLPHALRFSLWYKQLCLWFKKWFQPTHPIRKLPALKVDVLEGREVPATFTVTNHLNSGPGSLSAAIEVSNATAGSNTIVIASSAIGQLNLTASLPAITQAVTIDNSSGGGFTINGENRFQIFASTAPLILDKIAMTQGFGKDGGAIDIAATKSAPVTLNTCIVTLCKSTIDGGGLYSAGGNVTINHSTFSSNRAQGSSGGAVYANGNIALSESEVISNSAKRSGGGLFSATGNVQIRSSAIQLNVASQANGGGIYAAGSVVVAGHTSLARVGANSAKQSGGGIFSAIGMVSVTFANVDNNVAKTGNGGGIYEGSGNVSVNAGAQVNGNSVLAHGGGGVYVGAGNVTVAPTAQ